MRIIALGKIAVRLVKLVAEAGSLEELSVRRGRGTAAEVRRERFALLLVDQPLQRRGVGFLTDVPVRRPGKLAEAGNAAGLSHARQPQIEPVSQQARHQDAAVGGGLAGAQMSEAGR